MDLVVTGGYDFQFDVVILMCIDDKSMQLTCEDFFLILLS